MTSRVFCIRHIERDKANTADPQTPTCLGEIQAYAMGVEVRREYDPDFRYVESSPQPRAIRTARIFLAGVLGSGTNPFLGGIHEEERLNDFSTDGRTIVADGIAAAKAYAKHHGLEIEQAMFLCPTLAQAALQTKCKLMMDVISILANKEGDSLMCVHGSAIDAAAIYYHLSGPARYPSLAHGVIGDMVDKAEGFVVTFKDGKFVSVKMIRQPKWLKALAFMM